VCRAAGPFVQEEIVEVARDKNFEMIGVDLWNGSASQLNEYKFVTQVKFLLLQQGTNELIPWGLSVTNVIIVDPAGIIQGILSVADRDKVVDLIDLINNPAPVSELRPKSLYWGTKGEVGVERTIKLTISNTGLEELEVTDIRSSTAQVLIDRISFTVAPGGSEQFTLTLSPTEAGMLTGSVEVITNEKNWKLQISSILIEGPLPPAIALSTTSVDYGTVEVGKVASRTVEIRNDGLGPLNVTGLETDIQGLSFPDQAFTVAAGESKLVTVSVTPSQDGLISGIVNVLSDDPANCSLSITFSGLAQVIPGDARADFDGSGTIDFVDFLGFAGAFGTPDGTYDVDQSGSVDFSDFLVFVENFGRQVQP
jgi:hypothetical protein